MLLLESPVVAVISAVDVVVVVAVVVAVVVVVVSCFFSLALRNNARTSIVTLGTVFMAVVGGLRPRPPRRGGAAAGAPLPTRGLLAVAAEAAASVEGLVGSRAAVEAFEAPLPGVMATVEEDPAAAVFPACCCCCCICCC